MLYHWYELDLDSSDATSELSPLSHDQTTNVQYNRVAAKAEACGASCLIAEMPARIILANDIAPDRVAEQLLEIGVGTLCNPLHSAQPGDYDFLPQALKRLRGLASWFLDHACRLNIAAPKRRRDSMLSREHTIVSNNIDDQHAASDDARRQRFGLAGQQ
jgi:hypothetical protein